MIDKSKLSDLFTTKLNSDAAERIVDAFEKIESDAKKSPKVKFKLSDDEFLLLLKTIEGRRIPISMLDDILPYKVKRDKNGKFIGLPGGLDERAKSLGVRLSRFTYENPESGELLIEITLNSMTKKEVDEFLKMRDARLKRYFNKSTEDLSRVACTICKTRVQIGKVGKELKVYCACDESPIDTLDITNLLDLERVKKWK